MANELYSRPLSREARKALIDFLRTYIESLQRQRADEKATEAKKKAIKLFETDIDILNFVGVISTIYSPAGVEVLMETIEGKRQPLDTATMIVEVFEKARAMDIGFRTN